jgi:hypothetical protein
MQQGGQVYTDEETVLITRGSAFLDRVAAGTGQGRSLKHSQTLTSALTQHDKKSGLLIGHVEATIRASPEEIVAYQMHNDSKIHLSQLNPEMDVRYGTLETKTPHHIVVLYEGKAAPGFANRIFLNSFVWQKLSDAPLSYIWVNVPIERHDKVSLESEIHTVRAEAMRSLRLTRIGDDLTKVQFACSIDLKGHFPRSFTNGYVLPHLMRTPYDLQMYFLQVRPPSECTADDGTCVGNLVADVAKAAKKPDRAAAIRTFVMRTAMLRECGFATLEAMLIGTLATPSFSVCPKDVPTHDPTALTAAEAETIGRGLESILRLSATHVEALDELLVKYPALAVTAQQHVWFRPMLETIAKRRMASAPLGLKLRLGMGAGLSFADMISDLYSIVNMLQTGHAIGAYGMIGLLSASLVVQLLVAIIQNKHRGSRAVAEEVFLVLLLIKPGVDASRVASGSEQIAGAPLDTFTEMAIGKFIEIAFEAAPGAALQASIVLSGGWSAAAVVSVGISCVSTGFATTMMAFDYDTNPAKRKANPEFYGFTPDRARMRLLVFVELFTLHAAHAMLKTITIAMLFCTNWRWLVVYMTADHCVFIAYKVARGDLIHFIPGALQHNACSITRSLTPAWQHTKLLTTRRAAQHLLCAARRSRDVAVLAHSSLREGGPRWNWPSPTAQPIQRGRLLLLLQRSDDARCMLHRRCTILHVLHWHGSRPRELQQSHKCKCYQRRPRQHHRNASDRRHCGSENRRVDPLCCDRDPERGVDRRLRRLTADDEARVHRYVSVGADRPLGLTKLLPR